VKVEELVRKVEELEEELRKVRQKLTVQMENVQRQHAEELLAVESAHAVKLERCKQKQDTNDRRIEKMTQEIARLQEEKRDIQTTVRRPLTALNDSETLPGQQAAAATAKQPSVSRALVTSSGVVEQWCITQCEAEVTRLRRELNKKEKEINLQMRK